MPTSVNLSELWFPQLKKNKFDCHRWTKVSFSQVWVWFSSVQSLSRVRLCDPMNRSMPGFPVRHQLPESTQTRVHRASGAIQPSHPLSPFSCPQSLPASGSFPMSQLFTWGGQSIGVSDSRVEYYLAIKKDALLPFSATWMELENIILSEIGQTEKYKYCMMLFMRKI